MAKESKGLGPLGCIGQIAGMPFGFVSGLVCGLAASVAAMAGMVFGVRLLTGKMPFLSAGGEGTDRQISVVLVPAKEAGRLYAEQWNRIGREPKPMWDEIQATMQK